MSRSLFTPVRIGNVELKNRIVMAPMTRSRAQQGSNVPSELAPTYYAQRASAGLIITEASQVSPQGVGYIRTPGIHTREQARGWQKVTDAVHAKGGKIFIQLWHVGRVSHPDFHGGALPVAPSAIAFEGEAFTPEGRKKTVTPRALEISEVKAIVKDFENAARLAKEAGFDGVEIHGANGYLAAQFLEDGSNTRTDEYGGSLENRARFLLEITDAAVKVWGPGRVGVRVSPGNPVNGMRDSHPELTYAYVARQLSERPLAYLHILEPGAGFKASSPGTPRLTPILRALYQGTLIVNAGYTRELGQEAIESGKADIVAFGIPFIANPDLVERFKLDAELTPPDFSTFYAGEEKGYIDYPTLAQAARRETDHADGRESVLVQIA